VTDDTLLLRQVHPGFVQNDRPSSQIFRPTPKDELKLSVYDGDLITPEQSWKHFTGELGYRSVGVLAVTVRNAANCRCRLPRALRFSSSTRISTSPAARRHRSRRKGRSSWRLPSDAAGCYGCRDDPARRLPSDGKTGARLRGAYRPRLHGPGIPSVPFPLGECDPPATAPWASPPIGTRERGKAPRRLISSAYMRVRARRKP
jgi:hypothetical protein